MRKLLVVMMCLFVTGTSIARGFIDADVMGSVNEPDVHKGGTFFAPQFISVLIFLNSAADTNEVLEFLHDIGGIEANPLGFMPVIAAVVPKNKQVLNRIAEHVAVAQISSNRAGSEELEVSAQALLLVSSPTHPNVSNWWDHGFTGSRGVVGLIDSGVAVKHLGLQGKRIIVRNEKGSGFFDYSDGVRSAHGTGVACIYAGLGTSYFPRDVGIAYGVRTIVAGLAGEGVGEAKDLWQTLTTLDWMLTRAEVRPTVINYSFGNGVLACPSCPDWSGLAKAVDYVVNHDKILWVKSAGNFGYIEAKNEAPFASTMTVPADNYNGITVANMNPTIVQDGIASQTSDRNLHVISNRSSRGPTLNGRKKPDLSAPGDDTWTCAPDPDVYPFRYTDAMHYQTGYRLMGGTSSAAPHVGAAILLMQDAGIDSPMMEKALLLNSADAWTDSNLPGPTDTASVYLNGHFSVMGSSWNRTYGWGYINLQRAFDERTNLIDGKLTLDSPTKEFEATLAVGGKVTLVHERRVGYLKDNTEWKLSLLSLEIVDAKTGQLIMRDDSPIDTVHQVANCTRNAGERVCVEGTKELQVIIRVKLLSPVIHGSDDEPFVLAASSPIKELSKV